MKTQTSQFMEGDWRRTLGKILLLGLLTLSGVPVNGASGKVTPASSERKASRTYPVAHRHRLASERPAVLRALPVDRNGRVVHNARATSPPVQAPAHQIGREIPAGEQVLPMVSGPAQRHDPSSDGPETNTTKRIEEVSQPPANRRPAGFPQSPSTASLVRRCDVMALEGLVYKFGADDPSTGGFDCSGVVQYLLRQEGIRDVPRTAFTQYQWLKKQGTLNKVSRWTWSQQRVHSKLRAGDLMFWTGTYNTGKSPNISHIMIYLGRDANNGKHYMFGASSRRSKGIHGHAVDVYEFVYPRKHGKDNFAGFGSVPGLRQR